jgi:hypothetical protein
MMVRSADGLLLLREGTLREGSSEKPLKALLRVQCAELQKPLLQLLVGVAGQSALDVNDELPGVLVEAGQNVAIFLEAVT